jgi:hypothetical protein
MEWVLVIYVYAGMWAKGDSVALTNVPVATQELCISAGERLSGLTSGSSKTLRYECIKVQ